MLNQLYQKFLESTGVSTDTRNIKEGNIFFALKGENFNGNLYAEQALDQGASFAVVDEDKYAKTEHYFLVPNVLETLQKLATHHRKELKLPIIALTGSNGKTTTKELLDVVLSQKYKTVATKGNLNNHIGVPLTLLSMSNQTELGVVEMGANHIGEIAMLCEIAQPDYGYITNFGKAHLEGFGSVEGVIKGKSELYNYLDNHGKAIFVNAEDNKQLELTAKSNRILFGKDYQPSITLVDASENLKMKLNEITIQSNLIGVYNSSNIAAALAIGHYFKVSSEKMKQGVETYIPSNNRSQILKKASNTIILDAYNANPTSMAAALQNLAQTKAQKKVAIIGDMFELGATATKEHQYIAELALELGIDEIILVGENFKKVTTSSEIVSIYNSTEKLIESDITKNFKQATILIKGSRGMALERVLQQFQ